MADWDGSSKKNEKLMEWERKNERERKRKGEEAEKGGLEALLSSFGRS